MTQTDNKIKYFFLLQSKMMNIIKKNQNNQKINPISQSRMARQCFDGMGSEKKGKESVLAIRRRFSAVLRS